MSRPTCGGAIGGPRSCGRAAATHNRLQARIARHGKLREVACSNPPDATLRRRSPHGTRSAGTWLGRAGFTQQVAERAFVFQPCEDEEFRGNVLIFALLSDFVGNIQQLAEVVGNMHAACITASHAGHAVKCFAEFGAQLVDVDIGLGQQAACGTAFLIQQRDHHMRGFDELVITPQRE